MRIGLFATFFPQWSETFIADQAADLVAAGHEVEIICLAGGNAAQAASEVQRNGVVLRWTPLMAPIRDRHDNILRAAVRALRFLPESARRLRRLYADGLASGMKLTAACAALGVVADTTRSRPWRYDVIQSHFGTMGVVVDALRELGLLEGPVVATFHGSDVSVLGARNPRLYAGLFERGDAFTVNSAFLRDRLLRLGAPPARTFRLPTGVDTSRITVSRDRAAGPARLLSVARLSEEKGLDVGLRALANVRSEGIEFTYTVIGDGPLRKTLETLCVELGLRSLVRFEGARGTEAVRLALASHDIFVLPGVEARSGAVEAQGRALLEAQAAGLPVVASRIGGVPETVGEGAGDLVPSGDVRALAEALSRLIRSPHLWSEMGDRGRRHVLAHYEQREIRARLEALYRAVARGEAPASAGHGTS